MSMRPILLLPLVFVLGACATGTIGLKPGESTEADVRRAMGKPAQELPGAAGTHTLVYTTGPLGTQTFMAGVDGDGKLRSLDQVLDEDHLMRIQTGSSTQDDVLRIIGPPSRTVDFTRRSQVAWMYRFRDTWGYLADFTVSFDPSGVVTDKATVRIDPSGNHGNGH
jgi:SmpA / OmlA family